MSVGTTAEPSSSMDSFWKWVVNAGVASMSAFGTTRMVERSIEFGAE